MVMNVYQKNPPPDGEPSALDLLTEIYLLKENGSNADIYTAGKLFEELLIHYGGYLRNLAYILAPFDGSTNRIDPEDLYAELVVKIWNNPDGFNPKERTPSAVKKQFIGWASAILKNHVRDMFRSLNLAINSTESIEELGWDGFSEIAPDRSEHTKIAAEILLEIDPDDAEILRWTAMAAPLDGSQMRTDPEEREEICRKLNVTPVSLRKKRERAIKAFKAEVIERCPRIS
jgi:RNA polymerase sigma factor (sigma-70 family)